jgi:glucosyl-dolichyl phosphate glucuronosyltransferase
MIRITLVVPTFNRANYLRKSIPHFLEQTLPDNLYEIIVVDNNSNDDTQDVVYQELKAAKCSWSYIFEAQQGLHYARNRGIKNATGDIIVFGDDDIIASPHWLEALLTEFKRDENIGIIGGKILPLWDKQPEKWIYDYGTKKIHPLFAYLDYGSETLILEKEYVFGCNFAIRKNLAIKIGGSYPDTFPKHLKHLSGTGESAMVDNVRRLNYQVVYLPQALVYHVVETSRVNLDYFIDRHERWAIEEVYNLFRNNGKLKALMIALTSSFVRLCKLYSSSKGKINPRYFCIVERKRIVMTVKQTVRVISSRTLFEYINKKSYI